MGKKFKYIKIRQPIGDMYVVKLNADFIINISASNRRRPYNDSLYNYNGDNNYYEYVGIQRKLEISRVLSISEYCKTNDAMFPTPIILSAPSDKFLLDEKEQTLEIPDYDNQKINQSYCSIVDGQHRLEGIKKSGRAQNFELIVEFIFDTDPSKDAYLFSVINGNQKAISKSLIYDLYGLSKSRTVEKLCNKVMKRLNTDINSCLRASIKMLGYKDELSSYGIVSQARMIDELKKLITDNSSRDNYDIEYGRELKDIIQVKEINSFGEDKNKGLKKVIINKYVFRNYFIEGNDEEIINLNIVFFNQWLLAIREIREDLVIERESFLEKSLGLSVGYRVMQLLYSNNMFLNNTQDEIRVSFESLHDVLNKMFYVFFRQESYTKPYYSTEAGMSDLFMELCIILYKKEIIEDAFFYLFLTKTQYDKLIKFVRMGNNKVNNEDKI